MGKIFIALIMLLCSVGISEAQVTQGTVFSKTEDGNGNHIGSTVVGPDRGLNVFCLGTSCTGGGGGGGGTSSLFGAAFPASGTAAGFADGTPNMRPGFAVDVDTGAGTTYAQGVNLIFRGIGGPVEAGTVANPFNVAQSGTWNIGTVTTLTSITNPVAVTQSGVWSVGRTWTLSSGTDSVTVGNAFLLDATFTGRFPAAFLSADNIAAQTATFVHGGCYGWDSGGGNWDRCLLTAGALNVSVQNATLSVTQGTSPWVVSGTVAATQSGVWSVGRTWALSAGTDSINLSQVGGAAISLGGNITAASIPVNIATDQVAVPVKYGTIGSANNDGACPSGAVSFTALASNASRTWAAVWASPANTDDVFIKLGATATSADARFAPGQALNLTSGKIYTGVIDAIPASGTQAVCVMELN